MRRKWIGWFTALAVAAFLIPFMPWFGSGTRAPSKPNEGQPPQYNQAALKKTAANQEHAMKHRSVEQDMNATAKLCTTECSRNFRKLMTKSGTGGAKDSDLRSMMDKHKQMVYVYWKHNGQAIQRGKIPAEDNKEIQAQIAQAKKNLAEKKSFVSEPVKLNGQPYIVLTVAGSKKNGDGIVGVIRQDIVNHVQAHQRRNLRIVPYPMEGKYKIESVLPNTMKDTTVTDGNDNGNASHYHINEVVVKFRHQLSDRDLSQIKHAIDALSIRKLGKTQTYVFRSTRKDAQSMMNYFKKNWNPYYVEPHYLYLTNETAGAAPIVPNDVLYHDYQWNLPVIETEKGWGVSKGSDKVLVAVLDTGVQTDHPDLAGKLHAGTNIVTPGEAPEDDVGHGTHVAGIIAAVVNNSEGVAGLSWYNKVLPVKVLDSSGAGSTYSVAEGIIWATDNGAKVINMSLGNYAEAEFLHDAIKYAFDRDVVLIAASGNDNTERPGYPAAYPEVFAVASTDPDGSKSSFSNYGDYIDVAAPGASIASTYPGSQYAALSGTSMASPHVAALAGLIRSINPKLTNTQVMDIMRNSAHDLGTKGKDKYFGHGQIDVVKALNAARQSANVSLQRFPQQVENRLAAIAKKYNKISGK
ncbi:S8 family peptidase [Paenibacillus spongiae]|uniref:S8 family peptidase n=1 Tax=Paenibacillus spongiae TaxID=2909671 RepID=A0ABY5SIS5_9BACL|nr:S8 family peptidase [Paenibacillus spongiae]UVI32158.1 S8 family peptidase [Paenibacillus spongiae]